MFVYFVMGLKISLSLFYYQISLPTESQPGYSLFMDVFAFRFYNVFASYQPGMKLVADILMGCDGLAN